MKADHLPAKILGQRFAKINRVLSSFAGLASIKRWLPFFYVAS